MEQLKWGNMQRNSGISTRKNEYFSIVLSDS